MPDLTASYFVSSPPAMSWNASPPHCFLHGLNPYSPAQTYPPSLSSPGVPSRASTAGLSLRRKNM